MAESGSMDFFSIFVPAHCGGELWLGSGRLQLFEAWHCIQFNEIHHISHSSCLYLNKYWLGHLGQHFIDYYIKLIKMYFFLLQRKPAVAWWRHQMETFSALLALWAGNSPVTGEFPTQRPVTRNFDVFFDLRLNKRLSKQLIWDAIVPIMTSL